MTAAQKLFEKMYEKTQGAAGAGPDMSNMGGQAGPDMGGSSNNNSYDGDVVDGDYKEV